MKAPTIDVKRRWWGRREESRKTSELEVGMVRGEGGGNFMRILTPTDGCLFSLPAWWSLQRQQGPGVTQIGLEFSIP